MRYTTSPTADADDYEASTAHKTSDYYKALNEVSLEIRAAFAAYFAGKPGVYVPYMAWNSSAEREAGLPASEAAEAALDYPDTCAAFQRMLITGEVAEFRRALVSRHIDSHAADLATLRTGYYIPRCADRLPKFLTEAI